MKYNIYIMILWAIPLGLMSCGKPQRENMDFDAWGKYWFQGKAEISSFELSQYRYGEVREGESVLIFVTEDLSRKKQVKLDDPQNSGNDAQKVLKLNHTREFVTGIYPYHLMLSVFTPVYEKSNAVKMTLGAQDWCGQTFTQLNLKSGNSYKGNLFSYFEQEGDASISVSGLAEDDIWNLLRINPNQVPLGGVQVFPSLTYQRFTHQEIQAEEAFIRIIDLTDQRKQLELTYSSGKRILKIDFEKSFPFEIMAWEEVDIKANGLQEVTKARRKAVKVVDYWTRNKVEDEFLRKELNLIH